MNRRKVLMMVCTAPIALIGACAYEPGYGPPPHAPAWGRRRKMVWDPVLGVYVVAGLPGLYYAEPFYYRRYDGHWQHSRDLDHWEPAPRRRLPPGLAKKR
jgi:hypothetical protein